MQAAEAAREALLKQVGAVAALYDELTAIYRGWLSDSLLSSAEQGAVHTYGLRIATHLQANVHRIRTLLIESVAVASESARKLAGEDFVTKTAQRARRDLEALTADEIQRRIVTQLQRDQAVMIQLRAKARLRRLAERSAANGLALESELQGMLEDLELYRPDSLGRRRRSIEYVTVETQSELFGLCNTLVYALLLQSGQTSCTLDIALKDPEIIRLSDFMQVQQERMHPRSTILITNILES